MNAGGGPRWLLIGNSRWHWAEPGPDGELRGWDGRPSPSDGGPPPLAWAAVGRLPDPLPFPLERRVCLADVPLSGCPPWLGVDRALAGWGAWREMEASVLVVDGGTVLSLTRVDAGGTFRGGRLLAGRRLQLEAMATGTALLPSIPSQPELATTEPEADEQDPAWPQATATAMGLGVEAGLAAAVIQAAREAGCRWVVLTGGDGALLHQRVAPELECFGLAVAHRPLLCLESLARLRPAH
ncbi:MAG: type III pantothenate kinase [Cyanobacteriota bacterium]|nr:type III pantothenate kinase [Cyanobacteriota bacterium]